MAGTIKLDGATFLEKDGGNYKITNTELKLKSSGNTIVDSSGNAVLSESGGNVSIGDVRLPTTGGIKDSAGNNVLSESGGAVTLDSEVNFENTYWLQAKVNTSVLCSGTSNPIYFDGSTTPYWVITGDTTNFVQGTNTKDLKFLRKGVYLINISFTGYITGTEKEVNLLLNGTISGSSVVLARAFDSATYADSSTTYANTCVSYAGVFNSNDEINVNVYSGAGGNINLHSMTHLNISLIRPLA